MILDTLNNAAKHIGLKDNFSEAFGFLDQLELPDLLDGRYEILNDHVFAIIAHETGRRPEDAQLEGHRKYIDIQYVISGDESIGWKNRDGLINSVEYDEEKDLEFFEGSPDSLVRIPPGSFAMFFPEDAHLPLIGSGPIHKVVIKVAVD